MFNDFVIKYPEASDFSVHQLKSLLLSFLGSSNTSHFDFVSILEKKSLAEQEKILSAISISNPKIVAGELDSAQEYNLVKQFLFRYKMKLCDDSVLERIGKDDFFEIYDHQGIQIYRSWSFFKFCRYSIDEILTQSWSELYNRPEFVTKKLLSLIPLIFGPAKNIVPYNIQQFVLSEAKLSPSMSYEVHMKWACPIEDIFSGQVVAFLSIASAKKIESRNFSDL